MPKIAYKEFNFNQSRLVLIDTVNDVITDFRNSYGLTLSLRQIYYQLVSANVIENKERSYKNLGNLVNDGRLAGLIDWNAIEDRGRGIHGWLIEEDEQEVLRGIEYGLSLDFWERQRAYVEVWVEKDALSSVIERPCREFRVPHMPCKGYLSASEAWRAGRRFQNKLYEGRRCVIIHLGDHDPSGIDMSRDNSERVELFAESVDVELRRIALNMPQIEEYSPPPNPAKITDSRAADYIAIHGSESWELDALNPGILDRLIRDEIGTLIDPEIWDATKAEENERRETLAQLHDRFDDIKEWLAENG